MLSDCYTCRGGISSQFGKVFIKKCINVKYWGSLKDASYAWSWISKYTTYQNSEDQIFEELSIDKKVKSNWKSTLWWQSWNWKCEKNDFDINFTSATRGHFSNVGALFISMYPLSKNWSSDLKKNAIKWHINRNGTGTKWKRGVYFEPHAELVSLRSLWCGEYAKNCGICCLLERGVLQLPCPRTH